MNKNLNIVFTIDENYIQHFTVTLVSILENNKDIRITAYIILNVKDFSILEKVKSFFQNTYNTELIYITIDDSKFSNYKISHHLSIVVYFRLLLSELLPNTIDRVLFLDADTLVTGSLLEFVDIKFGDNYIAAIRDSAEDWGNNIQSLKAIGIPIDDYFNAGVMLVNLKLWRLESISTKLIDTANEYMDRISWWDQDILNIYFLNRWYHFDSKYNALKLSEKCEKLPVIIHYNTHTKPWHYLNYHPYKYLYWQYIKLTPFKNAKIQEFKFKRLAKKIIYKLMNKKYKI